jgi:hypothetical protein
MMFVQKPYKIPFKWRKYMQLVNDFGPFLDFLLSFIAFIALFFGAVDMISVKREFSMYFDRRDQVEPDTEKKRKFRITRDWVLIVVGAVLFVVAFFL